MGAVVSRTPGYTNLTGLIGAFAFHAIFSALGAFCVAKADQAKHNSQKAA